MQSDHPEIDNTLAQIRHDLKTPLNQILGYSELLLEESGSYNHPNLSKDLQRICAASKTLLNLLNDQVTSGFIFANQNLQNTLAQSKEQTFQTLEKSIPKPAANSNTRIPNGHILVVDDQQTNRDVLSRMLVSSGLRVTQAQHGAEAIEILRATPKENEPPIDVVLLDIMMPVQDGYATLAEIKSDSVLRHLPVIMISALDELDSVIRCVEIGAEDYLAKPFNPTLLKARLGASLEKKLLRDAEQTHLLQIESTQKRLSKELDDAAKYLCSLFPSPTQLPLQVDWKHQPCSELGGDAFGYHWIDENHFAIYLLDVCGHGVGASLLSASAINVIRNGYLPVADMRQPSQVLAAINDMFLMERQNNMFFTLWYGVYNRSTQTLSYGGAGHPDAILRIPTDHGVKLEKLSSTGPIIGIMEGMDYDQLSILVPKESALIVPSDGCFEVIQQDGSMMDAGIFDSHFENCASDPEALENWFMQCQHRRGDEILDDDFTIVRALF
jgi:sigma-B regulation protein RsbU (phosphoserine phosphatase)